MIETIKKFLKKYNIINESIIVGFSAGPDSTALSLALFFLKNEFNLKIILAYFNHNWREEAKHEEEFTEEFAKQYGYSYVIGKAPLCIKKDEQTARDYRYKFFNECAEKFNSKVVMLAHNKNDNVETLVYRIIKGTSIKGLTSIPENREIYYRPLLDITKKEILDFLKNNNQKFLFDSSNLDTKYKRNFIRKKILPMFEEINPNYMNSIDNLIKNSIASKKIIDDFLSMQKKEVFLKKKIIRSKFLLLNIEVRYEILNEFLCNFLKNRDYKTIKKIDTFILDNKNSQISLNSEVFLRIRNDFIYIYKQKSKSDENIIINGPGNYLFSNLIFRIDKIINPKIPYPNSNDNSCFLSIKEDVFPLTLRYRRNGDVFSPIGLKDGKMKLKDYFINQKIPQEKRDDFALLCKDKEVLWILGERISEKYKANYENCFVLEYYKRDLQ